MTTITPFKIAIPEAKLADLQQRLANTILASEVPGAGWSQGPTVAFVSRMIDRLQNGFDWRAQEHMINERLPGWRVDVQGRGLHFARGEGVGPAPMPLLLLHGWPGSFAEMYKVAPLLAKGHRKVLMALRRLHCRRDQSPYLLRSVYIVQSHRYCVESVLLSKSSPE